MKVLSMESQPQNPEFRNNPENIHSCLISCISSYTDKLFNFSCTFAVRMQQNQIFLQNPIHRLQ